MQSLWYSTLLLELIILSGHSFTQSILWWSETYEKTIWKY